MHECRCQRVLAYHRILQMLGAAIAVPSADTSRPGSSCASTLSSRPTCQRSKKCLFGKRSSDDVILSQEKCNVLLASLISRCLEGAVLTLCTALRITTPRHTARHFTGGTFIS